MSRHESSRNPQSPHSPQYPYNPQAPQATQGQQGSPSQIEQDVQRQLQETQTGSSIVQTESTEEWLDLHGGIENLLSHDLLIVDSEGKVCWRYPHVEQPAGITWQNRDGWEGLEKERKPVNERFADISGCFKVIGSMNGVIDLVEPLSSQSSLVDFWHNGHQYQFARVEHLPDMKRLRKDRSGMARYCVVTRGVAILAYYQYEELERLLVPALSVRLPDGSVAYRALMPATFLLPVLKRK